MANRVPHMLIGAGCCAGAYILIKKYLLKEEASLEGVVAYAGVGAVLGILPDLIEPANNPHHRAFFHSLTLAIALGMGNYKVMQSSVDPELKTQVAIGSIGYGSHLLLDALSTRGLPLI